VVKKNSAATSTPRRKLAIRSSRKSTSGIPPARLNRSS
jgi:hypothetical protein